MHRATGQDFDEVLAGLRFRLATWPHVLRDVLVEARTAGYDPGVNAISTALAAPVVLTLLAAGYLAGSIPVGLILAKFVAGQDVRAAGSGNIGATNVARVVGKKLGALTLLLDATKGFIPVLVASRVGLPADIEGQRLLVEGLVALAALLGHCFPVWLKFHGGKGVATGLGVMLAHRPDIAAIGLIAFALAMLATRRVSAGSLLAAVAVLVALGVRGPRDVTLLPLALCAVVIVARHHQNIRRLLQGQELKV
jgi:acyl phosphate:glycerol-3-phosphate acyltransferase